jgi:predicted metal-dependent TIM-barrel fold hydrolase
MKTKDEVRLWNENELLKKQLEIAKDVLNIIKISHPTSDQNWIIVQEALEEIESAGE